MPGQNEEEDKAGAGIATPSPLEGRPAPHRCWPTLQFDPVAPFGKLRAWFGRQTRSVRGSMFMIAMFATINLLTNGLSEIWFVFPSIPFAFFLVSLVARQAAIGA